MLVDPTGSVYDDSRLDKNLPRAWKKNAWMVYKIRSQSENVKETVFLTRFIDLNAYN